MEMIRFEVFEFMKSSFSSLVAGDSMIQICATEGCLHSNCTPLTLPEQSVLAHNQNFLNLYVIAL